MNKAAILREKDRFLMQDFSSRCTEKLRKHLLLKVFLSLFQRFLEANFLKEAEKDGLVIDRAVVLFAAGRPRGDLDVDEVFALGKGVDEMFVKRVSVPPLSLEINYADIEAVRKKRILLIRDVTFDLLVSWREGESFQDVLRHAYDEEQFRKILSGILHLYNLETKLLGNSIAFHKPAEQVKDVFAQKLFAVMEEVSEEITGEYARNLYAGKGLSCVNPT